VSNFGPVRGRFRCHRRCQIADRIFDERREFGWVTALGKVKRRTKSHDDLARSRNRRSVGEDREASTDVNRNNGPVAEPRQDTDTRLELADFAGPTPRSFWVHQEVPSAAKQLGRGPHRPQRLALAFKSVRLPTGGDDKLQSAPSQRDVVTSDAKVIKRRGDDRPRPHLVGQSIEDRFGIKVTGVVRRQKDGVVT
jgi:hypothetical protein